VRLALAAVLLLAGCATPAPQRTIADVVADPARYGDEVVELSGNVIDAMGLFSVGLYTLSDGTAEIQVMTTSGLPAAGTKLTVRGTVSSGVTFGGKHYGVALNEQERVYTEP
jgi:hypothetical protein